MQRTIRYFLLLLLVSLWACTEDNNLVKPDEPTDSTPGKEFIELLNSLQPFIADASDSQVLKFKTNCQWRATVDRDWCKLSSTSGEAGEQQLSITVDVSEEMSERDARLEIVSVSDTVKQIYRIVQKQRDALILSSERGEIGESGGQISVVVKANVDYEYVIETGAETWLTPARTRSLEENTLLFDVAENKSVNGRSGKIIFSAGSMKETYTLYQEGEEPQVILYLDQANPQAWNAKQVKVDVKSNVDFNVEIPAEVSWCHYVETRGLSSFVANFTLDENVTDDIRSVQVAFVNKAKNIREEIEITQMYKGVIAVKTKQYELGAEAQNFELNLEANVKFSVKTDQKWITYKPETRAMTTSTLLFSVEENAGQTVREAKITLDYTAPDRSEDHVVEMVRIIQANKVVPVQEQYASVTHKNQSFKLPVLTGEAMEAEVKWDAGMDWQKYRPMIFNYVGDGPFVFELKGKHIEEIHLKQLTKVEEIDLSRF